MDEPWTQEQSSRRWQPPRDEESLLEYIAYAWERRVNFDRRRLGSDDALAGGRRQLSIPRRAVDRLGIVDEAERRLFDAKERMKVLREYHAYLGDRLANGECDDTLRHTEEFFTTRTSAIDLVQVADLLGLLEANCDCEAHDVLRQVLS